MKQQGTLFLRRNLLLTEGLFAAAAGCFADTLLRSVILCGLFFLLMLTAVPMTAALPARVPVPVRTLVYSAASALVYVPALLIVRMLFDLTDIPDFPMFLPLLCPAILLSASRSELLSPQKLKSFLFNWCCCTAGVSFSILLIGFLRELLGAGTLLGRPVFSAAPLPLLSAPCGGLILIVILGAAVSAVFSERKEAV